MALAGGILGGVGNLVHSMIDGLLLGVLELSMVFVGVWVGEYRPIIPILVLAWVLYFAPEGLIKNITSRNID